jgi:hypothetical protein
MRAPLPLISITALLLCTPVLAQEVTAYPPPARTVPNQALEITLGAGYAQGVGDIAANQRALGDISRAGAEISLGLGYRIDPNWMIGVYGSGSKYAISDFSDGDIWSATAGVQGNYHFLPQNDLDPWVGLASGWRGHWVKHANGLGTDSRHGWDIARLTAGLDFRLASQIAVAPYVSAGVTTFLTQELANESSFSNIHDPRANVWLAVGVQGRFDLFSSGGSATRLASN